MVNTVKITTKRMLWPNAIRLISVILVILIHTSAGTVLSWGKVSASQWMIGNIFDSLARISVPLFIMISGSLLIHKKDNLILFIKKRLNRIILPWFFWGSILLFLNNYLGIAQFGEKNIKLLLIENYFGGFWFMPMLVGIYIVAPIVKKFVNNATQTEIKYFFGIWFLTSSLIPTLNNIFELNMNFITPNWFLYLGYFIAGHQIVHKLKISKDLIQKLIIIFLLNFIITIVGTYQISLEANEFSGYLYEFVSLNVLLMSLSSFIILFNFFKKSSKSRVVIKNILGNKFKKLWAYFYSASENSFGILLSHILILKIFTATNIGADFYPLFSIPILAIIIFIISNALISELKKIKWLKKVVG